MGCAFCPEPAVREIRGIELCAEHALEAYEHGAHIIVSYKFGDVSSEEDEQYDKATVGWFGYFFKDTFTRMRAENKRKRDEIVRQNLRKRNVTEMRKKKTG